MSSSTRASDASDASRSHRSVEGDEKPHGVRERERHTAKKPRYYIRGFELTTHSGLGRIGAGVASSATSSTIIMSSTWASVVPAGKVPKDYPHHFDGLSARPVASVSRRSPRNRAHRGHRAGFFGVGRACRPGPASAASRSLQKIVGVIVGAASRAGREHLQGSSPPDVHHKPDTSRNRPAGAPLRPPVIDGIEEHDPAGRIEEFD